MAVLVTWSAAVTAEDIGRNSSCEQVANGRPVGWGVYGSLKTWGTLDQGYQGKGAYFVPADFKKIDGGPRPGEEFVSAALVLGSPDGFDGSKGIEPPTASGSKYWRLPPQAAYKIGFWVKNDASRLKVCVQQWGSEEATGADRTSRATVAVAPATPEWTRYENTVSLRGDTKRFALMFHVFGYKADGLKLGRVCVDEVTIEPAVVGMTADDLPRLTMPDDPAVYVGDTPIEKVLDAYRAGDEQAVARVQQTLQTADDMAAKPDAWYRQFYRSFEPRAFTFACPIHPLLVSGYNEWDWSLDEPWKLICPYCKAEGRKYYYYPNPDYPDDGQGCAPTDDVWARTHDAAWSKANRSIPHDHWDGRTHGYLDSKRFYFLGKYYKDAMRLLVRRHALTLALAYQYATRLFPAGSEQHNKGKLYAHKPKVIMFTAARAHLGDDYLAAAEGLTPAEFRALVERFYRAEAGQWPYDKLAGFRPFSLFDLTLGDPVWAEETKRRPYGPYFRFAGSWNRKAYYVEWLLDLFCRLSTSFGDDEQALRRVCWRTLVSVPGDREKVALGQDTPAHYLKRGTFEMEIHAYDLETGGDNLASATQRPKLRAGLFLRDSKIIETVALDLTYFLRNFFTGDGLSREGSPSYTGAGYAVTSVMDTLYGLKGDFDANAPYFDRDLGALNLFKMDDYKNCATKLIYYVTEDDLFIPWEDSVYGSRLQMGHYVFMEKFGGGIPEKERKYLIIDKRPNGGVTVRRNVGVPLPPVLLHDRRKAILRAGSPVSPTVVSLDFTKKTGHYHPPSQTLMVHACGQELASDLGYLGSNHELTTHWIKTYAGHNCLTLRAADGNPRMTQRLRGDLRKHFIDTPACQVVDSAEYDAADWADAGQPKGGELSRQVFLIAASDDQHYVVDIARARGGATHDYYLHCHGLGFEVDGIKLAALPDADTNLHEHSGWTFKCRKGWGAKNMRQLRTGRSQGAWRATWSRIDDYRKQPKGKPLIHNDVFMRLWMVDEPGSEVIVGAAPAQRWLRNDDYGRTMKMLCVRRPNTERIDKFVAVIEPYRDKPFVKSVRRLDVQADDYTVALAVETIHGVDYVVSYGGPGAPSAVTLKDGAHAISTDGDVAIVSHRKRGVRLLLAGGKSLAADGLSLKLDGPAQWTGRLVDFNDAADTLVIESEEAWPTGATLAGRPIVIQHREDRSTFAIKSVERIGDGRYLVQLDDQPHLMNNWLRVRKVTRHGIVIEPPPVLDSKRRTYKVYAGAPDDMRLLGPLRKMGSTTVRNEIGTDMLRFYSVVIDDYSGVEPGQDIGITRLEKGRDMVFVTNMAYMKSAEGPPKSAR